MSTDDVVGVKRLAIIFEVIDLLDRCEAALTGWHSGHPDNESLVKEIRVMRVMLTPKRNW